MFFTGVGRVPRGKQIDVLMETAKVIGPLRARDTAGVVSDWLSLSFPALLADDLAEERDAELL